MLLDSERPAISSLGEGWSRRVEVQVNPMHHFICAHLRSSVFIHGLKNSKRSAIFIRVHLRNSWLKPLQAQRRNYQCSLVSICG